MQHAAPSASWLCVAIVAVILCLVVTTRAQEPTPTRAAEGQLPWQSPAARQSTAPRSAPAAGMPWKGRVSSVAPRIQV